MKSTNSAPLILKLVGSILILSALIDFITLLIPIKAQDNAWVASTFTQMVDRGIIPMIGLALLFLSYFLESGSIASERSKPFLSLRFWALALSTLLGLAFLFIAPLHMNNTRILAEQSSKQIDDRAANLTADLNSKVQQRQDQLTAALKDEKQRQQLDQQLTQIGQAIASGQLKGDQLAQATQAQKELQQLKSDPSAIESKAKDFRNQGLIKITDEQKQLKAQAETDFRKTSVRVGLSSLLLALGYSIIAWTGFREMGVFRGSRLKAPVR